VSTAPAPVSMPWSTGTLGVVWAQRLGSGMQLESHVSVARFGATLPAAADSMSQSLSDGLLQTELATKLSWHALTVGASLDVLDVSYRVSNAALPVTTLPPLNTDPRESPLTLVGAPTIAAAYAERRWGPADSSWRITTGVRGMSVLGMTARLEPRVDGAVRVVPGLIATAGVGRTHQVVQSLRNTESALGAEIGVDLPVAAGTGGVPLAQSDVATAGLIAQLGAVGRFSVDGYVRAISGLAIADPLDRALFATRDFVRASARVDGLAAQLTGERGIVAWQVAYGIGSTVETGAGVRYDAPSALGQTGSAAIGVALDRLTQLRLAGWAAYGQRAPGLDGASLGRDDDDDVGSGAGDRDLGTSQLSATRLPPYLRADVQLAHQWRVGPARGRLSSYVTLANIFNHANIAGQLPTGPNGAVQNITLLPRTVLMGFTWAY
jgi:hypothetical protein